MMHLKKRNAWTAVALALASLAACSDDNRSAAMDAGDRGATPDAALDGSLLDAEPADGGDAGMDAAEADPRWLGRVPEVCDGSNTIRLSYRIVDRADRLQPGSGVTYQNGSRYWLITGDCEFFVMDTFDVAVRSGTLAAEEAQAFGRRLHFGEPLAPRLYEPDGAAFDASTLVLSTGSREIGCYANCVAPPAVEDAFANARAITGELVAKGTAATEAMRVALVSKPHVEPWTRPALLGEEVIEWPLVSVSADDLAHDESHFISNPYAGTRIDDPTDVATMLRLRHRFFVQMDDRHSSAIFVRGGVGFHYELYFRDAIWLEDEDGFMRTRWPEDETDAGADDDAGQP